MVDSGFIGYETKLHECNDATPWLMLVIQYSSDGLLSLSTLQMVDEHLDIPSLFLAQLAQQQLCLHDHFL